MAPPHLVSLSNEYYDLNGSQIDVLDSPPSAMEFSRLVHISRPVLIRGLVLPACRLWDDEYLAGALGDSEISVAVTPNGRADAVTPTQDGPLCFAEPATEKMTMGHLLSILDAEAESSDVYYLQSQNGNVYSQPFFDGAEDDSEFTALRADIPSEIPWCSEALGRPPDAVNLWIGSKKSVTSIHSDPYENVYHVVRGVKRFMVLPPAEGWCVKENIYPHATWVRQNPDEALSLKLSQGHAPVRWATVNDPNALPKEAHPIHITVNAGETLYLPPGWWHQVRQEDRTIALNWWYDMEMRGMSWALLSFMRDTTAPSQ